MRNHGEEVDKLTLSIHLCSPFIPHNSSPVPSQMPSSVMEMMLWSEGRSSALLNSHPFVLQMCSVTFIVNNEHNL